MLDVTVYSENYKMIYENTLLKREIQNKNLPLNQMLQVKVNPRGSDEGCDDPVQEVRVAAGQVLEGAIVSDTESDGLYPNNACQEWKIITDVNLVCFKVNNPLLFLV